MDEALFDFEVSIKTAHSRVRHKLLYSANVSKIISFTRNPSLFSLSNIISTLFADAHHPARGRLHVLERQIQERSCAHRQPRGVPDPAGRHPRPLLHDESGPRRHQELDSPRGFVHAQYLLASLHRRLQLARRAQRVRHLRLLLR